MSAGSGSAPRIHRLTQPASADVRYGAPQDHPQERTVVWAYLDDSVHLPVGVMRGGIGGAGDGNVQALKLINDFGAATCQFVIETNRQIGPRLLGGRICLQVGEMPTWKIKSQKIVRRCCASNEEVLSRGLTAGHR